MPFFSLNRDAGDWLLVWSRMLHPTDDTAAIRYAAALIHKVHGSRRKLVIDPLLYGDSLPDIEKDALDRVERANNAGAVLHYVRKMGLRGKKVGLRMAYEHRDGVLQSSGRKYGESRVKSDFYEFRTVAHLWCAHTFTNITNANAEPVKALLRKDMPYFLAVAECYRKFGEEWTALRRKNPEPLLYSEETWKVPDDYPLPEFSFTVDS